jgi:hypothetical protein
MPIIVAPLSAESRFILAAVFAGQIRSGKAQPGLIDIKDENAVIAERNFLGLKVAFIALVSVLPVKADFIVVGGDPLFAACQDGAMRSKVSISCIPRPSATFAFPTPPCSGSYSPIISPTRTG